MNRLGRRKILTSQSEPVCFMGDPLVYPEANTTS
jgi:hypothetical protein